MNSRLRWIAEQFTRRLWFRAGLFGVGAIVTALVSAIAPPLLPERVATAVGAEAVEDILGILASSMLVVVTFSLGTMVSAFSAASNNATPRACKLLIQDPTSQNALATFLGAFIFSLIGIIALSSKAYGVNGRFILFIITICVVIAILTTFFKWIDYLSQLGQLGDVLGKVERTVSRSLRARRELPHLGGRPLQTPPGNGIPLRSTNLGYVQHLDVGSLSEIAEQAGGTIYVNCLPGSFCDGTRPLAWLTWTPDDDQKADLLQAFAIGAERLFDQDPRFGLIALSEIASRALSPGINDPGTAIDVIGRIVRVLAVWSDVAGDEEVNVRFPNIFVPGLAVADLFDDAFTPIARDGAGTIEVGVRLQKAFISLGRMEPTAFRQAARRHSDLALRHANAALPLDEDKGTLAELSSEV